MKRTKMSLSNVQGMLSRDEMKRIMAGSGSSFCSNGSCKYYESGTGEVTGVCQKNSNDACVCKGPNSSVVHDPCDTAA